MRNSEFLKFPSTYSLVFKIIHMFILQVSESMKLCFGWRPRHTESNILSKLFWWKNLSFKFFLRMQRFNVLWTNSICMKKSVCGKSMQGKFGISQMSIRTRTMTEARRIACTFSKGLCISTKYRLGIYSSPMKNCHSHSPCENSTLK